MEGPLKNSLQKFWRWMFFTKLNTGPSYLILLFGDFFFFFWNLLLSSVGKREEKKRKEKKKREPVGIRQDPMKDCGPKFVNFPTKEFKLVIPILEFSPAARGHLRANLGPVLYLGIVVSDV